MAELTLEEKRLKLVDALELVHTALQGTCMSAACNASGWTLADGEGDVWWGPTGTEMAEKIIKE